MPLTNNVMIVRHKLLTNLIKLWKDNQLVERIDRLPIELSPRTSRVLGRCCVHKERAVWKYKSFPLMGFDMSDETDELTPLSEYARKALERKGQQQKGQQAGKNTFHHQTPYSSPRKAMRFVTFCRACLWLLSPVRMS